MICLGVVSQAIGQGLILWGLKHLSASMTSVTIMIAPITSVLYAWLFLSETITVQQLIGIMLILIGIYLAKTSHSSSK